jgi:hypothetical protein
MMKSDSEVRQVLCRTHAFISSWQTVAPSSIYWKEGTMEEVDGSELTGRCEACIRASGIVV